MVERERPGDREHERGALQQPRQRDLALRQAALQSDLRQSRRRNAPERKERHEHDPLARAVIEDLLMPPLRQAVVVLHGGDRQQLSGPLDLLDAHLGQADALDDSAVAVLSERLERRLQRRLRVDAVQVVEVDAVPPEPLKALLDLRAQN